MKRRDFIAGAAVLPAAASAEGQIPKVWEYHPVEITQVGEFPAPEIRHNVEYPELIERVMSACVPTRSSDFIHVRTDDLKTLCDAAGVRWRGAWWE